MGAFPRSRSAVAIHYLVSASNHRKSYVQIRLLFLAVILQTKAKEVWLRQTIYSQSKSKTKKRIEEMLGKFSRHADERIWPFIEEITYGCR